MNYKDIVLTATNNDGFLANIKENHIELICSRYSVAIDIPFKEIDRLMSRYDKWDAIEIIGLEIASKMNILNKRNKEKKTK
jgi:hypothetical protein